MQVVVRQIQQAALYMVRRLSLISLFVTICMVTNWGEPERAPHDQSNGDRVCLSVCLSVCVCVHRTFTFRIYACSNLTQMCNISLVQSDSTSRVQVYGQYSTAR